MTAIRIIDDHLELANIGSNTHAQIDTHIAAADDYVKRDGSLALTADWDIGDTRKILSDEIRARDGAGLKLYDDGSKGIFVKDGGNVGIGTDAPSNPLQIVGHSSIIPVVISGVTAAQIQLRSNQGASFLIQDSDAGADLKMCEVRIIDGNFFFNKVADNWARTTRLMFDTNGNVGIGTTAPTALLDVNSDIIRLRTAKTPATAGASGNQGDICWDADFIYVCTATNSWERAAIAAW